MNRYLKYFFYWIRKNMWGNTPQKPTVINFPIINICNSRCLMCNVWKNTLDASFDVEDLALLLENDLFSDVQHIGISGGEPSLRDDLFPICKALIESLPKLQSLSITTNGYLFQFWEKFLPQINRYCKTKNVIFTLNISLDGLESVHDNLRGIPGAFDWVNKTIDIAKTNFINVQLQCTVSKKNVYNVVGVVLFSKDKDVELIFRLATEIHRLNNRDVINNISLDENERSFFADFLKSELVMSNTKSPARRLFYRDLASRLGGTQKSRKAPCYFQREGLVVTPELEITQCSRTSEILTSSSNIKQLSGLYFSPDCVKQRTLTESLLCPACYHDQNGAWNPFKLFFELMRNSNITEFIQIFLEVLKLCFSVIYIAINLLFLFIKKMLHINCNSLFDDKIKNIVVIGAYGGEHVGDAAILGGVILRMWEEYRINKAIVLSIREDRTKRWVNCLDLPVNIEVASYSKHIFKSILTSSDALVYGGGPIMDLPKSLISHLNLIIISKHQRIPFIIEGVGFGPFRRKLSKGISNIIIRQASKVRVRTKASKDEIQKQIHGVLLDKDPAFDYLGKRTELSLISEAEKNSLGRLLRNVSDEIIGINLRPLWNKYSINLSSKEVDEKENSFVNIFAESLITIPDFEKFSFIFFPMNPDQYGFSDLSIAFKLQKAIHKKSSFLDFRIWEFEPGIDALLYLIRNFSFAFTMRFHACIFCISQNISTIGLDYMLQGRGKVYELFNDLNMDEFVINVQDFQKGSLKKYF